MSVFHNIAAVLFDLDGTLIDSASDLGSSANQMRLDRGLPSLPMELYRPMAGAGARGMLGIAFGITGDDVVFESMREEFFSNYQRCMTQQTKAFDGVVELVRQIDQLKLPWGVVTNKSSRFTDPLTKAMPLFQTAQVIVSGDTTPYSKPHPAPMLEAARRLGVDPARCVYIGDDERDVAAGHAAGMYTVAANYGYLCSQTDTSSWGAHAEINFPLDLLQLIASA